MGLLLLIPFFFISLFNHQVDAIRSLAPNQPNLALIKSICKESQDYNFCMTVLAKNPRARPALDKKSLLKVAIGTTVHQALTTVLRIPAILRNTSAPLGRKRLAVCQSDYKGAVVEFQRAYNSSLGDTAYNDVADLVAKGANKVINCEVVYSKEGGPMGASPLVSDNLKIYKLWEIILIILAPLVKNN